MIENVMGNGVLIGPGRDPRSLSPCKPNYHHDRIFAVDTIRSGVRSTAMDEVRPIEQSHELVIHSAPYNLRDWGAT